MPLPSHAFDTVRTATPRVVPTVGRVSMVVIMVVVQVVVVVKRFRCGEGMSMTHSGRSDRRHCQQRS